MTLHRVHNYGSVLQTYATQELLKSAGADVQVIDYWRPTETEGFQAQMTHNYARWNRPVVRHLYWAMRGRALQSQSRIFRQFVDEHIRLTDRAYYSLQELQDDPPRGDFYCAGSDQIWNEDYHVDGSRPFYLDFGPDDLRRFSFSSSFGKTDLTSNELDSVRGHLGRFSHVSVREDSAVGLLRANDVQASHLLDPTLGLPAEQWLSLAARPRESEYILVYQLHRGTEMSPVVKALVERTGLQPITVRGFWTRSQHGDRSLADTGVKEFLGLLAHASHVVTDSFHGTAFSLNLGRPLTVVYPPSYSERLRSLLDRMNALDRVADTRGTLPVGELDAERVQERLAAERRRMNDFLRDCLAGT